MNGVKILGVGSYAPERIVTNEDFTRIIETSDEWITTRTGMKKRHISQGEPTWFMGTRAVQAAIENAGIDSKDIGLIISTSITADFYAPSMSCIIQREIGAIDAMTIDVNCACAGFVYGFDMARRYLITDDSLKYAVVVANENLSKLTDYSDRSTCVLFGDGAAACILELSKDTLYSSFLGADGTGASYLFTRSIPSKNAFMPEKKLEFPDGFPESNSHYIYQNGKEVYKFAIKALPNAINKALEKTDLAINDIDLIIPHQANTRIIETAAQRLGISMDKMYLNIEEYGNTSSASIPLALDEAWKTGRIKKGDNICLVGFGAGLTYAAVIFEVK
ncbi:MAG: beta-ketoacyl-ACP synthase III [Oscillospiraceae bacterium]